MHRTFARACLMLALTGASWAHAQEVPQVSPTPQEGAGPSVVSPILTIDSERLFLESAFGQRVAQQAEAKLSELGLENRQIEADLEAEEQALTDRRPTLTPAEFRTLADAFDTKVQQTRATQAAKARTINETLDADRDRFLNAAAPILERLMRQAGAAVILDRRAVFVSASAVEITEEAIEALDASLGTGRED